MMAILVLGFVIALMSFLISILRKHESSICFGIAVLAFMASLSWARNEYALPGEAGYCLLMGYFLLFAGIVFALVDTIMAVRACKSRLQS